MNQFRQWVLGMSWLTHKLSYTTSKPSPCRFVPPEPRDIMTSEFLESVGHVMKMYLSDVNASLVSTSNQQGDFGLKTEGEMEFVSFD